MNKLSPLAQRLILYFGEMGNRWGINRTVGQIYALLYILGRPLNIDEIAQHLALSRSNVAMGVKELQARRLVKPSRHPGDRRAYVEAPNDVWEIFRALLEERRRHEVEPTLSMLRDALQQTPTSEADHIAQHRMREMYDLMELSSACFGDIQRPSPEAVASLMQMGPTYKAGRGAGDTGRAPSRMRQAASPPRAAAGPRRPANKPDSRE